MMETYYGYVKTPADAIKLFEACRLGLLPRVQRRLSEKERGAIRSGSVFVWDEREAGMRRWTDGKSWSASRVSGSFLTYREMEGKRGNGFGGSSSGRRSAGKTPDSGRGSDDDPDDGPDGYRYKADGLMKQSFSITTTGGQHLHLISYYARGHQELAQPTTDPTLRQVVPVKGMYPESSLNEPAGPATMRGPMHQSMYSSQPPHQGPPHHGPPHQGLPHQGYPPQYPQPGAAWPPSPVATPPFSNGHYQPSQPYPPTTLPPPQHHHSQTYSHGPLNPQYERLPQPTPSMQSKPGMPLPQPYPSHPQQHSQQHQQHPSPRQHHQSPRQDHQQLQHQQHQQLQQQPHQQPPPPPPQHHHHHQQQHAPPSHAPPQRIAPLDSTRAQHLQAAAREAAVMIDPQLAANIRAQQGPLPALGHQSSTVSPPPRNRSISPPGNQNSQGNTNGTATGINKASLSALLHPSNSDSGGASNGGNSANSSPRAPPSGGSVNGPASRHGHSMEARAIGALDKGFCIT